MKFLPQLIHYPALPNLNAVFIACLYIFNPKYRRQSFGTVLLNAVLEDLTNRKIKVVETIARKRNSDNPSGPAEFYVKNGFSVSYDDKEFPLLIMGL